jgi:hypothetical protein
MGLRSTHRDESHKRCRPRVSGDPRSADSRFRGNDVTSTERSEESRSVHKREVEGRGVLNSSTFDPRLFDFRACPKVDSRIPKADSPKATIVAADAITL